MNRTRLPPLLMTTTTVVELVPEQVKTCLPVLISLLNYWQSGIASQSLRACLAAPHRRCCYGHCTWQQACAIAPWLVALLPLVGLGVGCIYRYFGTAVDAGNNLIFDEVHDPERTVPVRMTPIILSERFLPIFSAAQPGAKERPSRPARDWPINSRVRCG